MIIIMESNSNLNEGIEEKFWDESLTKKTNQCSPNGSGRLYKEIQEKILKLQQMNFMSENETTEQFPSWDVTEENTLLANDETEKPECRYFEEKSKRPPNTPQGCGTPLVNLLHLFSPSSANSLKLVESFCANNIISDEVLDAGYSNAATNRYQSFNANAEAQSQEEGFYPGSMLSGKCSNMNAAEVECFINANGSNGSIQNDVFAGELSHRNSSWGKLNPLLGENMLPPVMLSNYNEIAMMQEDMQNNGGQQYFVPIFFQPMVVPQIRSKQNDKEKNSTDDSHKPLSNDWLSAPSDEELLNRCRIVADTSSNMRYLGEAAEKLLQCKTSRRGRKPRQLNSGEQGKFKCRVCQQTFGRQYTLDTHERIHTGSKPFKCAQCGLCFRQSGTRRNHIRAVHAKERPFVCQYCGKTFAHKSSITVHIRIHTKEKPHQCETCKRTFTDRATCAKHQTTHTGAKPYRCQICTKCFSQKSNLKRHFQNIHELHLSVL